MIAEYVIKINGILSQLRSSASRISLVSKLLVGEDRLANAEKDRSTAD
jgi:hypothetical protein